jgi:hypothetical protein
MQCASRIAGTIVDRRVARLAQRVEDVGHVGWKHARVTQASQSIDLVFARVRGG